jgi:two-component sensor histidine kinase
MHTEMIIQKSRTSLISILIQILVWAVFGLLIFFYQPLTWNIVIPYQLWIKQTIILSLLVGAYYLNAQLFVPKFLLKNNTPIYLLSIVILAIVIVILNNYADKLLNMHQLMDAAFHQRGPSNPGHKGGGKGRSYFDGITITITALVLGISTSITAVQKWQADKQLHQALEQEKTSSELSFLKAQINPHFFFNTLNNIYALTLVNVETSRKAIHQLSRMMRYVLYDTQQNHTMLSQEIAFIKDYISLMQLRLTEVVTISFEGPVALKDMPVAPMIFLPFIENAFKHGVSATQASYIRINIDQNDNMLELTVRNSIIKDQSVSLDVHSGIGLNNTRRRLDLLYPDKYTLLINESNNENEYSVHLTLNLS